MRPISTNNYQNIILSLNRLWPFAANSSSCYNLKHLNRLRWTIQSLGYSFSTLGHILKNPKGHYVYLTLESENPLIHTTLLNQLKRIGLPITLFIKTEDFIPKDQGEKLSESTLKTIELLKRLMTQGWDIGTMGPSMMDLTNLNHFQQLASLTEATESFTKTLGRPPRVFLYPFGAYDASTVSCLKQLNFIAGITSIEGVNLSQGQEGETFHLKRIYSKSPLFDILKFFKARWSLAEKSKVLSDLAGSPTSRRIARSHLNFWLTDT
jgi:hypothetical protein